MIDTEAVAGDAVAAPPDDVQGRPRRRGRGRDRAPRGDLGDRPGRGRDRPRRARRARALAPRRPSSGRSPCTAVATDLGVDLLRRPPATPRPRSTRCIARGAEPVGEEAAEIVRVESGRPALRARDDDGDDPAGGGHQRARGQLHQGLLHRPGDGRAAALQGQAEPPPARPAPRRRRPPPAIPCGSASASWARSAPPSSPPPAARSRSRSCAARPSPATTVEVGDGDAAEVVELPF